MRVLLKDQLIHGSLYEGEYDGYTCVAKWDSVNNEFTGKILFGTDQYSVIMKYPNDETEYYGYFFPYLRTT